jgi:hypothetical protein
MSPPANDEAPLPLGPHRPPRHRLGSGRTGHREVSTRRRIQGAHGHFRVGPAPTGRASIRLDHARKAQGPATFGPSSHAARSLSGARALASKSLRTILSGMSERPARLREAYHALGRGDLDPWIRLLDPRVVWHAVDCPDVPETPT